MIRRVSFGLVYFITSGCSHHYLPLNALESSEVCGPGRLGRLTLILNQSGANISDSPNLGTQDPETLEVSSPKIKNTLGHPAIVAEVRFLDRLDLGVRIQPLAPLMVRAKYQLYGPSESQITPRPISRSSETIVTTQPFPLSLSLGLGFGVLVSAKSSSYLSENILFMGGYRFSPQHLLSLGPFFTLAQLSGVSKSDPSATSASVLGSALHYQWTAEALYLRSEFSYIISGSFGASNIAGIGLGAAVGLNL